ncbi:hypothetical protein TRICI_000806 [Trichomonascus ciferrii]|uniref:Uncharacterized protein n=1 Tax=Trichomonascus ciferrii TaxID=44093 RepID=A0A642VB28_9ASCO|nr:hypothetical protein TRICI_000806 [Trichomonascus ciferrii]
MGPELQKRHYSEEMAEVGSKDVTYKRPAFEYGGAAADVVDNVGGASKNGEASKNAESSCGDLPYLKEDNISIQVTLSADKVENFPTKIEEVILEAFNKVKPHQNIVIEASDCNDTDIKALNDVLERLGIAGRRTLEYSAGVYRIVMPGRLHEVVIRICEDGTVLVRYKDYYEKAGSAEQLLDLQYRKDAKKEPDASFAPRCELLLHEVRRKVLDYLPKKPLPPTVFEMAATETTAQVNIDAERWHCGSYFVTEETLTIDFRPTDLSLVFTRRDFTVENIERVFNGLGENVPQRDIDSVKRCLIDRLDVKKAEKRALILVFEHWDDHDEVIRLLKLEFKVEWQRSLQKKIEYAYKKKRDYKWILKDLRRTLQRLNEIRERFPPDPPRASLEDYRRCYRVVDDRTTEVHVVDCDENGTVADRNAQELKLHIRPFVGFALRNDDVIHFTNTQLVELWQRALEKYENNAERRTDVDLWGLTDEGLRWQCKLLRLPTADLEREQMIQDIRREDQRNDLIIASESHIARNVRT